jgi:hypothetical protein
MIIIQRLSMTYVMQMESAEVKLRLVVLLIAALARVATIVTVLASTIRTSAAAERAAYATMTPMGV